MKENEKDRKWDEKEINNKNEWERKIVKIGERENKYDNLILRIKLE